MADDQWKPLPGGSQLTWRHEQDVAAGGDEGRRVQLADGRWVTGRVRLAVRVGRYRVYAYLRWTVDGRASEYYLGEVTASTRQESLQVAWRIVHSNGLAWPRRRARHRQQR